MDSWTARTSAHQLADLLNVACSADRSWEPDDLAAILAHQLSAPIELELAALSREAAAQVTDALRREQPPLRTFADLLSHPSPPSTLLTLTKQFAKAMASHPESGWPRDVGRVLYLATILVALRRCGERITELDDSTLRQGIAWALDRSWLDPLIREIFEQGHEHLAG